MKSGSRWKGIMASVALGLGAVGLAWLSVAPVVWAGGTVGTGTPGSCTEAALDTALSGGGSVVFDCGGSVTITLTSEKVISANTAIDGGGVVILEGGNATRLFSVTNGVAFTISQITLAGGNALTGNGGAIYNAGSVWISGAVLTNNRALNGGAIAHAGEWLSIEASTLSSNRALSNTGTSAAYSGGGGAILATAPMQLAQVIFERNTITGAFKLGGAILASAPMTIANSTFYSNTATAGRGGALYLALPTSQSASIINTHFLTNVARYGGGGLYYELAPNAVSGTLWLTQTTFFGNRSTATPPAQPTEQGHGGGLYLGAATTTMLVDSEVSRNSIGAFTGSGIANFGYLTVLSSTFMSNAGSAGNGAFGGGGGAIFSQGSGLLWVGASKFISNSSEYEGGAIDAGSAYVERSQFVGNTAQYGGAINVFGSNFVISASTFLNNAVLTTTRGLPLQGGAINTIGQEGVVIFNSVFVGNRAFGQAEGSVIHADRGPVLIVNSTFANNVLDSPTISNAVLAYSSGMVLTNVVMSNNLGNNCSVTETVTVLNQITTVFSIQVTATLEYPTASCDVTRQPTDPRIYLASVPTYTVGWTVKLWPDSPAIDNGNEAACPAVDQLGLPRPLDGNGDHTATCDIGAYEYVPGEVKYVYLPILMR